MYYLWTHKFHLLATFSLKMGHTILLTHLKVILLVFSISVFSFSNNKPNPNGPIYSLTWVNKLTAISGATCSMTH